MPKNFVSLNLTVEQLRAVDGALTELETQLSGLFALSSTQRRTLKRMGEKSEAFCRQALRMLEQNPQIVPPNIPVVEAVADMNTLDQLRPRIMRLSRLSERAADTDVGLGSDVMAVALKGYGLLKLTGSREGLEPLRRELKMRFAKPSRAVEDPAPDQAA